MAILGVALGIGCHALNPGLGFFVAVAGLLTVGICLATTRPVMVWLVYLAAGLVVSSLIYFGLAWLWQANPVPETASASGP